MGTLFFEESEVFLPSPCASTLELLSPLAVLCPDAFALVAFLMRLLLLMVVETGFVFGGEYPQPTLFIFGGDSERCLPPSSC